VQLPPVRLAGGQNHHLLEDLTVSVRLNEGSGDRVFRVLLGIALLLLTIVGPKTPWGFIGFLPLITGLTGFCPLYRLLGVNTCPKPVAR
jgi:hypothetical protein